MKRRTPRTLDREFRNIAASVEALVNEAGGMVGHEYFPAMVRHSLDSGVRILRATERLRCHICQPRYELP